MFNKAAKDVTRAIDDVNSAVVGGNPVFQAGTQVILVGLTSAAGKKYNNHTGTVVQRQSDGRYLIRNDVDGQTHTYDIGNIALSQGQYSDLKTHQRIWLVNLTSAQALKYNGQTAKVVSAGAGDTWNVKVDSDGKTINVPRSKISDRNPATPVPVATVVQPVAQLVVVPPVGSRLFDKLDGSIPTKARNGTLQWAEFLVFIQKAGWDQTIGLQMWTDAGGKATGFLTREQFVTFCSNQSVTLHAARVEQLECGTLAVVGGVGGATPLAVPVAQPYPAGVPQARPVVPQAQVYPGAPVPQAYAPAGAPIPQAYAPAGAPAPYAPAGAPVPHLYPQAQAYAPQGFPAAVPVGIVPDELPPPSYVASSTAPDYTPAYNPMAAGGKQAAPIPSYVAATPVPAKQAAPMPSFAPATPGKRLYDNLTFGGTRALTWAEFATLTQEVGWSQEVAQNLWKVTDTTLKGYATEQEFQTWSERPDVAPYLAPVLAKRGI